MHTSLSLLAVYSFALGLCISVNALVLPIRPAPALASRRSINATGPVTLVNFGAGLNYLIPITIGGQCFDVVLDTGSSDLWVRTATPIPGSFDSTRSTAITYGSGPTKGEDKFATVTIGGFTLEDQLYMEVAPGDEPPSFFGIPGILGVGPNLNSNLFNGAVDPFFTLQLGRPTEILSATPGTITFGETLPDLANITAQPQLPVVSVPAAPGFLQWVVLLEGMSVNSQNVTLPPSAVDPTHPENFVVLLDSGTSGAVIPQQLFDAIYGGIQGAMNVTVHDRTLTLYPCDAEVNVTLTFAGQVYPVHPLDVLAPDSRLPANLCAPTSQAAPGNRGVDAILGDMFLRSVYMLDHFGDTIRGGPTQPYIQLLSTVDVAKAHDEFVQVRVNGVGRSVSATDGPPPSIPTASGAVTGSAATVTTTESAASGAATASPTAAAADVVTDTPATVAVTDASTNGSARRAWHSRQ